MFKRLLYLKLRKWPVMLFEIHIGTMLNLGCQLITDVAGTRWRIFIVDILCFSFELGWDIDAIAKSKGGQDA